MTYMPEMIKQLKELGIREQFKVMVGGAPVIESWAEEIGSDGYGLTAKEAVQSAMELMIKDSQPKANSGKGEKLNKQYH